MKIIKFKINLASKIKEKITFYIDQITLMKYIL